MRGDDVQPNLEGIGRDVLELADSWHGLLLWGRGPGCGLGGSVEHRYGHGVGVSFAVLSDVVFEGWLAPTDGRDDASPEGLGVDVCIKVDGDSDGIHGVSNGARAPVSG